MVIIAVMDVCNLDNTFYYVEMQMSSSLFATVFILGTVAAACIAIVQRRRRMRMHNNIMWHPILHPTEECAKVRGILVVMSARCSFKFPADNIKFLPVQQISTDNGELVF